MDDEIARMLYAKRATPEPCHVCGGKCCRDDLGYRVVHMAAEFYEHVCDDCRDGEKYVPPRTAVSPLTLCTDPRCVSSQRCQRAEHEDFGNAPGLNYGPTCIPAPPAVERTYEDGLAAGERRATAAVVAYLRSFYLRSYGDICADMADIIERGEHKRAPAGKEKP
jgi:hypothetical protein